MTSAAATFVSLPELFRCLMGQVRSRRQLAALRLVNRNFNEAIKPVLFREAGTNSCQDIAELAESTLVGHIRALTISALSREGTNEVLRRLLEKTPRLETFRCVNPIEPATISTLHRSCPRIKSVDLDFSNMDEDILKLGHDHLHETDLRARELYKMPDLTVFTELEKLTLRHLYDDLLLWREQIIQVLKNSPHLRKLELSLSRDAVVRHSNTGDIDNINQYLGWFDSMCYAYGETGAPPLPLQSLHCGTALFPENAYVIERLVDLSCLEEVHIENRGIYENGNVIQMYSEVNDETSIVFDAFVNAPKLRRFTVATYGPDVHKAFCTMQDPSKARQIALCCEISGQGYEPAALLRPDERYPALPLHLRMLEVDLDRQNEDLYVVDDDGVELDKDPADQVLDALVSGDKGTLEGLVVFLPDIEPEESGLDYYIQLLERTLPQLVNLTQLCVYANGYSSESYPEVPSRLASAIPSLRYINLRGNHVNKDYWSIVRGRDGKIQLEELKGWRENEDVELYKLALYERTW